MGSLDHLLGGLPPVLVYLVVGGLVAAESAVVAGLVLPAATALIALGLLANAGTVQVVPAVVTGVVAAWAGGSLAYRSGRRHGPRLRTARLGRWIGEKRWERAERLFGRFGGRAVFVAQWLVGARTLVPRLAAMNGVSYRRFLAWQMPAAMLWSGWMVGAQLCGRGVVRRARGAGRPGRRRAGGAGRAGGGAGAGRAMDRAASDGGAPAAVGELRPSDEPAYGGRPARRPGAQRGGAVRAGDGAGGADPVGDAVQRTVGRGQHDRRLGARAVDVGRLPLRSAGGHVRRPGGAVRGRPGGVRDPRLAAAAIGRRDAGRAGTGAAGRGARGRAVVGQPARLAAVEGAEPGGVPVTDRVRRRRPVRRARADGVAGGRAHGPVGRGGGPARLAARRAAAVEVAGRGVDGGGGLRDGVRRVVGLSRLGPHERDRGRGADRDDVDGAQRGDLVGAGHRAPRDVIERRCSGRPVGRGG